MTREEKARAYDEALKKAKFYHGNCPSEPERKKLEKMFPVLCESEDERIRKRRPVSKESLQPHWKPSEEQMEAVKHAYNSFPNGCSTKSNLRCLYFDLKPRCLFQEGYEQAEKDTIERAVTWLKDNANKYIVDLTETYPDAPVNIIVGGMCWEDLTKYLKDNEQHREYTPRDREAKEKMDV